MSCPFCDPPGERVAIAGELTRVLHDLYPVADGHLLIVPRRHIARWSEASLEERAGLITHVDSARDLAMLRDGSVEGFNIGWNDGAVAGQTVMHLHIHVIPRRRGDVDDPRGGIRWVLPGRAKYW